MTLFPSVVTVIGTESMYSFSFSLEEAVILR